MTCIKSMLSPSVEIIVSDDMYNPVRGSAWAAAYDLRLVVEDGEYDLLPGEVKKFSAGFKLNIESPNIAFVILPRSGQGTKGLHIANQTGLLDGDYQGDVIVALRNITSQVITIVDGERYAQGMFVPVAHPEFTRVTKFSSETVRGEGGFGSTGTK